MSTTVVDEEFGTRLRLIMQQFGSVADLARAVGVSDNAIYKWVTGRGKPGMISLVNLAKAAGVSVEWLATGKGQPVKVRAVHQPSPPVGSNVISAQDSREAGEISRTREPRGRPNRADLPMVEHLSFHPDWLKRTLDAEARDLALIEAAGDSMSPTIDEADLVLADLRETRFKFDGVYLIRSGGDLSIKRLQRQPDGSLTIRSDNSAYPPVTVAQETVSVIGRVVWTGGRL
jgi:phage repressor protein C with HTH and peptisase S24 domain